MRACGRTRTGNRYSDHSLRFTGSWRWSRSQCFSDLELALSFASMCLPWIAGCLPESWRMTCQRLRSMAITEHDDGCAPCHRRCLVQAITRSRFRGVLSRLGGDPIDWRTMSPLRYSVSWARETKRRSAGCRWCAPKALRYSGSNHRPHLVFILVHIELSDHEQQHSGF